MNNIPDRKPLRIWYTASSFLLSSTGASTHAKTPENLAANVELFVESMSSNLHK